MGQTLTHGVYLPDEGERNCYSGLAANWSILDGAVGTVAEHSTQIAGKAPLVHTHTKSDITDFPAYGNAAGTICEGNDSRLSDARTPVAHTHGKADITDLFNSANTWSGEQTFSQTIQGNAATASAFDTAKSITLTGAVTGTVSGTNSWEIATVLKTGSARTGGTVTNPYFKIASWEINPNKYFGAILQIQNKCYPDGIATLIISVRTKSDATFQRGACLLDNVRGFTSSDFILLYKEVTGKVLCELYYYTTLAFNGIRFSVISEGVGIQEGNSLFNTMVVYRDPSGIAALPSDYTAIQTSIGTYTQDFIPYSNNTYNLGTSTNKWKTLNGVNPGALSILNKDNKADITSEFTDLTGGNNFYIPPADGFVSINADTEVYCAVVSSTHNTAFWRQSAVATTTGYASVTIPVRAGLHLLVKIKSTGVIYAEFFPCLGNV